MAREFVFAARPVTVPKLPASMLPAGLPKVGVFMKLNASARNCRLNRSRIGKVFISERSTLLCPSLRVRGRFRPTLPNVNAGELTKATLLSQPSIVGFDNEG